MATIKGGGKFMRAIDELKRKLSDAKTVQVGFFENASYPNGTPVAMVAAIQNYGAPSVGIPPRPFFSNMVADKSPSWPDAMEKNLQATGFSASKTLELMGLGIKGQLQQSIRDTNSPPLKESTLRARGVAPDMVFDPKDKSTFGAKPLIHTGHMINSVDYKVNT